ncbi:hypothetical protein AB0269_09795 [Microbacterium sp. NPDC077644]|uniref:hypothetical protein n=1 Tax=Microbacterium sp. NPDC077644 TaxID=3155055 RepID=UPI00344BF0A1
MTTPTAEPDNEQLTDDKTSLELIESMYARMGLATAQDRAQFLVGSGAQPKISFDVVISTSSQPFV